MSGPTAQPQSASRPAAIFYAWLGAFVTALGCLLIVIITDRSLQSFLRTDPGLVGAGMLIAAIIALVPCIGAATAVFAQSRIVLRHGRRLNAATALSSATSLLIWAGLSLLLHLLGSPKPEVSPFEDLMVTVLIGSLIAAGVTFAVLNKLLQKKLLLPPLPSLCPHCGYPIGVSSICTECGAQFPLLSGAPEVGEGRGEGMRDRK